MDLSSVAAGDWFLGLMGEQFSVSPPKKEVRFVQSVVQVAMGSWPRSNVFELNVVVPLLGWYRPVAIAVAVFTLHVAVELHPVGSWNDQWVFKV